MPWTAAEAVVQSERKRIFSPFLHLLAILLKINWYSEGIGMFTVSLSFSHQQSPGVVSSWFLGTNHFVYSWTQVNNQIINLRLLIHTHLYHIDSTNADVFIHLRERERIETKVKGFFIFYDSNALVLNMYTCARLVYLSAYFTHQCVSQVAARKYCTLKYICIFIRMLAFWCAQM